MLFLFFVFCVLVCVYAVIVSQRSPSNERNWSLDQQILPEISFDGDMVHIQNIRDFIYESTTSYTPRYYDQSYNLTELKSVDFIVEPFATLGAAHTFLSFGFSNNTYVAVSVEIRKQVGERFSPIKGLFRNYELMYVICDERDTILLRANHRKDSVYLYPIKTSSENMRALFVDMLTRAKQLSSKPEFYNTFTNGCTTNIVDHINKISPNRISFDFRLLFPANADILAYELGLIDTSVPPEALKEHHKINHLTEMHADDPDFSLRIRNQ